MVAIFKRAPLIIGDTNITSDCILLFVALTLVSLSSGTSCGRKADIAGDWTPEPTERTADATKSIHNELYPFKNSIAKISVDIAIKESDNIISIFRLYRSAHTPANGERKKVGTNPQIIDMAIITPDCVCNVIYHVIAY
ncbi:hypothetical protein SDC9_153741 [bioreactor metagenome]|uniref:Uncharacterized protein n=1 Tax=bioreactor metagenome TaxID=1076179 RepID=A0A645EWT4_9ZZZZ